MEKIIHSIIVNEIKAGQVFDTHAIIEYLLQNYSDVYLSSFTNASTELYHGHIGKIIDGFSETLIKRIGKSWSMNIHKKFTECTCWEKL
jgi:hypothetical protein